MSAEGEAAPHSLEEKLAQSAGRGGDAIARRTLASLRKAWGYREERPGEKTPEEVSICSIDRRSYWRREAGTGLNATFAKYDERREQLPEPEDR